MKRALAVLLVIFLLAILLYTWGTRRKRSSEDAANKEPSRPPMTGSAFVPSTSVTMLEISSERENGELIRHIGEYTNLEELKIHCLEDLLALPDEIGRLTRLKILDMDQGNGCSMNPVVPESIGNLQALETLNLAAAQDPRNMTEGEKGPGERLRHHLPASISRLKKLSYLNLGRNELEEIPTFVKDLPRLKELDVSWNGLKTIPAFLPNLRELAVLRLNGSDLADLPEFLNKLPKLREISLGDNCAITENSAKRENLQRRFPHIKFDFESEYDCPSAGKANGPEARK
jgi:hypothetical protein